MKRKLKVLCTIFFICIVQMGFTQQKLITGKVVDENGLPLPGVNIIKQDTSEGIQTDFDGNFEIQASENDILEFSYLGFQTQKVNVGDQTEINITLRTDTSELDEVLVVGYGTSSRRNLTDNVASISSKEINEVPVPSLQSTLTGRAAGVQVTQVNGKAESGIKIRVRGVSTISSSQEPLYVIDGIPLINSDENINDSPINPLISLNPNDIASIEILKDASSAAIYGARGTNGVVLITTKRGKAGETKISLNTSYGWSEETNRRDFLNTSQYVELFTEAYLNSGFTEEDAFADFNSFAENEEDWREGAVDTDWQDLAFQNGSVKDINVSASGGSEKTQYFTSLGHNRTEGIIRGNNVERYNFRTSLDHQATKKLKLGVTTSISKTQIDRLANDNQFATPLQAIAQIPFTRPFLDDGLPNPNTIYYNFLNQEVNADNKTEIWRAIANVYGEYQIIPSLRFRSELGYDLNVQTAETFAGRLTESQSVGGFAQANSVQNEKYVLNNYFTHFTLLSDNIDMETTAGMSFEDDRRKVQFVQGQGFPSDDLRTVNSAAEIVGGGSLRTEFTFISYFLRSTFNINDKYLLKGSIRYDGSSRFGVEEQYGLFPAFSGGWIISEEDFLTESKNISLLKLRASWGITGNADIGNFASRSLFGGASYNGRPALNPTQLGDPNLKWENTIQYDIGIDYGFFNNRLSGSLDYYNKTTDDLLLNEPVPSTSGFTTITRNIGEIQNRGVELVIETKNIRTDDLNWSTSFNISYNENEVTNLPGGDIVSGQNIVREGEVLGSLYMVEFAGADVENGDALFVLNTLNPDGTRDRGLTNNFNEATRVVLGSPFPDVIAGLTNNFYYKNFDFSTTFQGQWGASIYNAGGRFQSASADFFDNQSSDQLNRWQQPGDVTNVPQARLFGGNGTQNSSRYLQNADFIRLRNLTFGYTFPTEVVEKLSMNRLRIYLTAVNLLTFTDYDDFDPESTYDIQANNNINVGTAFYSAPPAKTITVGINFEF
jgi:TonB-linked SusC/RagA family outer membrane protein